VRARAAAEVAVEPQEHPGNTDDADLGVVLDGRVEIGLSCQLQLLVDSLGVVGADGGTARRATVECEVDPRVAVLERVAALEASHVEFRHVSQAVLRPAPAQETVLDAVEWEVGPTDGNGRRGEKSDRAQRTLVAVGMAVEQELCAGVVAVDPERKRRRAVLTHGPEAIVAEVRQRPFVGFRVVASLRGSEEFLREFRRGQVVR